MRRGRSTRDAPERGPAHRSGCPLASALDLVGDRWSLLVLRGLFAGHTRYGDFLADAEGIATNILASRLRALESAGLVERRPDGAPRPPRYRLTRRGADLLPVLQGLAAWGNEHIPGTWRAPRWFLRAKPSDFYPPEL